MNKGNQERANIVSNENGISKLSQSVKNDKDATEENPSHDEKKVEKPKENANRVPNQPEALDVLVNKQYKLPDHYEPTDLVIPNVRFIFSGNLEKKKMRQEAARALENMFSGAEKDGILLAGVSGYRSQATQKSLYNSYVNRNGKEAAERFSAHPGHSEHQTGLAMDISGITGKCAATDCFEGSPEAKWLAEHAHEYGFIVRYPKGKEDITGYKYEPWHMRFVGIDIANTIFEKDITMEEYFDAVVPVRGN
ncbi:M15 family metallopeptidase [Bacillus sp. FJAT-49870]|uniref:M15 family metallopeptidase n=2 Tax=Lederbergia citri TaxID=2833580 RepID=A0A942TIL5_9BACI|nr:M15 family metallopeptidase [Lederbergia citri]